MIFGMLILTFNSCKSYCVPGAKPQGLITQDQAANLEANYLLKKEQIQNGSASLNNEPQDFFWTIDELQNYICYAKEEAAKKGKKVNGFRFYLGAKPLNKTNNPSSLTLFVVPTEKKEVAKLKVANFSTTSRSTTDGVEINDSDANDNIDGIDPLDYAGAGHPPKPFKIGK